MPRRTTIAVAAVVVAAAVVALASVAVFLLLPSDRNRPEVAGEDAMASAPAAVD